MKFNSDSRLVNVYIPIFLFLVGFIWKLSFIEYRDICNDEPFTIFNAQKSAAEIIGLAANNEPTPPLFMLLLHFWIKLFGISPLSVRFLPLLFNSLTTVFIYLAGKRFISLWTGIFASVIFLLSNYHFIYGLETRTYSLFYLATAASLYFYLCYAENTRNYKALTGLIISNLVLVYSHHFGWFVIIMQVLSRYYYSKDLKTHYRLLIPVGATIIGFAPMLPVMIRQFFFKADRGTWLTPPAHNAYIHELYYFFNHKNVFMVILAVLALGLIFTLVMIIRRRWKGFDKNVIVLLQWWIVPYTVMFIVSYKMPMFNNKYLLFNSIGLYLFIGAAISLLYQKNRYLEPAMGLAILISMVVYMRVLPKDLAHREVKNSVEYVKNAENDKSIVILYPAWSDFQFSYYYNRDFFKDYINYYEILKKNGIYRVWGLPNTRSVIAGNPDKRIILIQDGAYHERDSSIFGYLNTRYEKLDSAHFPMTINVAVYDPKPK